MEDDNGSADLICQYFLQSVLKGASIGHATLMARQQYVANVAEMDATDLKTLAQFYLLGDPSIHPIAQPEATKIPSDVTRTDAERFFRSERRQKMKSIGHFLIRTKLPHRGKNGLANYPLRQNVNFRVLSNMLAFLRNRCLQYFVWREAD